MSDYNRFAQEPDETVMIIDGKRKVWDDKSKSFKEIKTEKKKPSK